MFAEIAAIIKGRKLFLKLPLKKGKQFMQLFRDVRFNLEAV
jgi:hypothetical protein